MITEQIHQLIDSSIASKTQEGSILKEDVAGVLHAIVDGMTAGVAPFVNGSATIPAFSVLTQIVLKTSLNAAVYKILIPNYDDVTGTVGVGDGVADTYSIGNVFLFTEDTTIRIEAQDSPGVAPNAAFYAVAVYQRVPPLSVAT